MKDVLAAGVKMFRTRMRKERMESQLGTRPGPFHHTGRGCLPGFRWLYQLKLFLRHENLPASLRHFRSGFE